MKYLFKIFSISKIFRIFAKLKIKNMIPVTLTINEKILSVKKTEEKTDIQSHYNPEFVEKIRRSEQSEGVLIKTEDLWK